MNILFYLFYLIQTEIYGFLHFINSLSNKHFITEFDDVQVDV